MFTVSSEMPITFASEVGGSAVEGGAELEVIKCIINREGYLKRVKDDFKGMGRDLRPELVDSLDFYRIATVDVVNAIEKWREAKLSTSSGEAPIFLWNGENYLLKMVTDLNFLDKNRTLKKWAGFSFERNPFAIPAAMEGGNAFMQGAAVDPKHLEAGYMDGFTFAGGPVKSSSGSPKKRQQQQAGATQPSPYSAPLKLPKSMAKQLPPMKQAGSLPAFVANHDMRMIREAERVILVEEVRCADIEYVAPTKDVTGTALFSQTAPTGGIPLQDMQSFGSLVMSPDRKDKYGARLDPIPVARSLDHALSKPQIQEAPPLASSPGERARDKAKRLRNNRGRAARKPVKKQTIGERLAEINMLRAKLKAERLALADAKDMRFGPKATRDVHSPTIQDEDEAEAARRAALMLPGEEESGSDFEQESSTDESDNENSKQMIESEANEDHHGHMREGVPMVTGGRLEASQSLASRVDPGDLGDHSPGLWATSVVSKEDTMDERPDTAPETAPGHRSTPFTTEGKPAIAPGDKGSYLPPEAANLPAEQLYDLYHWSFNACRIQTVLRGWFARRWTVWHRHMVTTASLVVQRLVRGFIGRRRAFIKQTTYCAARDIQRVTRGRNERKALARFFRQQFLSGRATKIQAQWRRIRGFRRVRSKGVMRDQIHAAIDTVNERAFFISDIDELRRRIQTAMRTPVSVQDTGGVTLPPDEALHLLRLTATLLYESKSPAAGKEAFRLLGVTTPPEHLTWGAAMQMLSRPETFLRMLRALALSPHARPPTVFFISESVSRLIDAFRSSPRWSLETFLQMGQGSKACEQIFKWLHLILDIARRQREFLAFLTESFPDWLPTLLERQREARRVEFEVLAGERTCARLSEMIRTMDDDPFLKSHVEKRRSELEVAFNRDRQRHLAMLDAQAQLCNTELKRESDGLARANRILSVPNAELTDVSRDYRVTLQRAERGDELAMTALPALRERMLELSAEVDRLSLERDSEREQLDRGNRRRHRKGEIPGNLRVKALAVGDYRAVYHEANVKASIFVRSEGAEKTADLTATQLSKMELIEKDESNKEKMVRDAEDEAYEAFDEYDKQLMVLVLQNADVKEKFSRELVPSPLEISNNETRLITEDAKKTSKRFSFVPTKVLDEARDRPRPVIVLITRDLPARSKSRIHSDLTRAMPGQFVTVDIPEDHGVDSEAMQRVLDAKKNLIMAGDYGLTKRNREIFLRQFGEAVARLVPAPFIVLIHGDEWNRRPGEGEGGLDQWLGVHYTDLRDSLDGQLKASLQGLSSLLFLMSTPSMTERMQQVEREMREPSAQYLIVMEALFVLQGSDPEGDDLVASLTDSASDQKAAEAYAKTVRRPEQQLSGVAWRAVRGLFQDPRLLVDKLKRVKRGQTSQRLRESLREYTVHPNWPRPVDAEGAFILMGDMSVQDIQDEENSDANVNNTHQQDSPSAASAAAAATAASDREIGFEPYPKSSKSLRETDPVLDMLASYVEAFMISEELTADGGGAADDGLIKRALRGSLTATLTVRDPDDMKIMSTANAVGSSGKPEFGSAARVQAIKDEAWQIPALLSVRAALADLRVLKKVTKIDGELFNVNVYREGEYIYFDAYSSETSEVFKCSTTRDEVSSLLLPDAVSVKQGVPMTPPETPKEMYDRLVNLLRFAKASQQPGARRVMVCRRDLTFIEKKTCRVSGHRMLLETYEEALGEVFLKGYVPAIGAIVTLHIDDILKASIDRNAHACLEKGLIESNDACTIWPYLKDRLKLDPPLSGLNAKGDGTDSGFGLNHARHCTVAGGHDAQAMGLVLKARVRGGFGRRLTARLVKYGGVRHIVEVFGHTPSDSLRIRIYEPICSQGTEVVLSHLQKVVLIGQLSDDVNSWIPRLFERLTLHWRGNHTARLDTCVYKAVQKVASRRMLAEVHVVDHNDPATAGPRFANATFLPIDVPDGDPLVRIKLHDPILSMAFECSLTKEDIIRILHYQPPYNTDVDVNTEGLDDDPRLVRPKEAMLRQLVVDSAVHKTRDLDSSTFDVPAATLLSEPFNITALITKVCMYAIRISHKDLRSGYKTVVPVPLTFEPFNHDARGRSKLALSLRDADGLTRRRLGPDTQQTPAAGDWSDGGEAYVTPALRSRRQATPLDMQKELNLLVQRQAQAMLDRRRAGAEGTAAILSFMGDGITDTTAISSGTGVSVSASSAAGGDVSSDEEGVESTSSGMHGRIKSNNGKNARMKDEAESDEKKGGGGGQTTTGGNETVETPSLDPSQTSTSLGSGGPVRNWHADVDRRESLIMAHSNGKDIVEVVWEDVRRAMNDMDPLLADVAQTTQVPMVSPTDDYYGGAIDLTELKALVAQTKRESALAVERGQDPITPDISRMTKTVFREGVKVHFREGAVRWYGHVACTVVEGLSWDPLRETVGRTFNFTCFESHTSGFYSAAIRSTRHLREVLGVGIDHVAMLQPEASFRMLDFIAHNKLEMVLNTTSWDGVPVVKGEEPDYRVEFRSDRLFDFEKITPVYAGDKADENAQEDKLIHLAAKRGMKIMRMARKVSGLLLQISVFELPSEDGIRPGSEYEAPTADNGEKKKKLLKRGAPMMRLIGYDAASRSKSSMTLPPEAVMELAGGAYSPFLELSRRKELAKILCQAALCTFPKGKSFEMFINWSGAPQKAAGIAGAKSSWRSSAERVIRRPGKMFRSAVRVSGLELVLTVYTQPKPSSQSYNADEKQVIFNLYAKDVSEAFEFVVQDEEQVERVGKRLVDFAQGAARSAAIRRMCKCCRAELMEDPKQDDKLVLEVSLLPLEASTTALNESDAKQGALVKVVTQSEKAAATVRYFSFDTVKGHATENEGLFSPRDAKGQLLHRDDISLNLTTATVQEFIPKQFICSCYLRNADLGVEHGVVVRLYLKGSTDTLVLHAHGRLLTRICGIVGEPDLIRDCVTARVDLSNNDPEDVVADNLGMGLERTDRPQTLKRLHERAMGIFLTHVRVRREDDGTMTPWVDMAPPRPQHDTTH